MKYFNKIALVLISILFINCSMSGYGRSDIADKAELVTIEFWADSTDMHLSGERALRDVAMRFQSNSNLIFKIEGKDNFTLHKQGIGRERERTLIKQLKELGLNERCITIISSKDSECLLLIQDPSRSNFSIPNSRHLEIISISFWSDGSIHLGDEFELRKIASEFKWNKSLEFEIIGKGVGTEAKEVWLHRANIIKNYLIKEGLDGKYIEILSANNSECKLSVRS